MKTSLALGTAALALSAPPAWAAAAARSDLAAESLASAATAPEPVAPASDSADGQIVLATDAVLLTQPAATTLAPLAGTASPLALSLAPATTSAAAAAAAAQYSSGTGATAREDRYTITLNQDIFFGFYPTFNGLIPVSDTVDFSFYGILWTTPSFGTGGGNDLWTEFGIGANFILADGALAVKPQVGLTNGALLSGGVLNPVTGAPTRTGSNFADGIVPSLTINYADDAFEAEFYGGYYAALRNRNENAALDFLHTWVNAGVKFGPKFSAGAHYEILSNTRNTFPGGNTGVVYQWLGPYVQFATSKGFFARFSAGADIEEDSDGDFYKLTAGWSF